MERQLGLKIRHRTAPEETLSRNWRLPCLHRSPYFGFGGVPHSVKNLCFGLLKEIPSAPFRSWVLLEI